MNVLARTFWLVGAILLIVGLARHLPVRVRKGLIVVKACKGTQQDVGSIPTASTVRCLAGATYQHR